MIFFIVNLCERSDVVKHTFNAIWYTNLFEERNTALMTMTPQMEFL